LNSRFEVANTADNWFKVSEMDRKTLSWWRNRCAKIDMDPPYQRRGRLWSETDKGYLVDSILNGFDIPKIYMADFTGRDSTLNKKRLPYAIIDGKQRFEAIFDFFDGTVQLNADFVYLRDPSLQLGGLGYKDLQANYPEIAEEFETYNLFVMSVEAQREWPINELFVRLNRSKALTGAEIRNAMSGPAPEVFRKLAKHELFETNVSFAVKRGQDLNAAAKVLMFEYHDKFAETKKRNMDAFVKEMAKAAKPARKALELAGRRTIDTFDAMSEIFLPNDSLLASAGVFPVYYWLVRETPENEHHKVREFLTRFEAARYENRQIVQANPHGVNIDRELVEYDSFNRSTNDLQSHEGRYRILEKRFYHQKPAPRY
jgi:hypothetical protein